MHNVPNHSAVSSRQGPTQSDGRTKASNALPNSRADVPIFGRSLLTVPDWTRAVTYRDRTAHLGLALCSPNSLRREDNETMVDWGSRTRAGSIEVDYQTELQQLVLSVFIQVRGVVRIGMI